MIHPDCCCPLCRRFPATMKKISELEGKPMSEKAQHALETIVRDAYMLMIARLLPNAEPNGGERR